MASQWKRFSSLFSSRGVLCILLSTIISNGLTEEIIVFRFDQDIFGTDDIGDGYGSICSSWCTDYIKHSAESKAAQGLKYSCKCQCSCDHTFLIQPPDKKYYKTDDLKKFFNISTNRLFVFGSVADLNTTGAFSIKARSDGGLTCQIDNVTYLYQSISSDRSTWAIDTLLNNLTWTTLTDLPKLMGKIVKIELQGCWISDHQNHYWNNYTNIFIETKGNYTQDFSSTSTSHIPTAVMSSSIIVPITPTTTPTPTPSLISTPAVLTTSLHVGCSISSLCSISPSARVPYPTIEATTTSTSKPKDRGGKEKQSSETGTIVGSVIGFVVIVAVIIIVLVVLSKKRREKSRSKETITMSQHSKPTTNAEDNELEYDYAAIDGDSRSHGNQATNGTAPQVYQSLDPARDSDPLYNILDRSNGNNQDYMEPGVHIDKGHNKRPTSKQDPQNNEPVYNVLEEPNQGGSKGADEEDEPEYNVVEDPDNAYDYACVEGNIRHPPSCEDPDNAYDYACVEGNIRHPSSCDNVGYESTLGIKPPQSDSDYAVLEGPSSEPSYQPLQIKAQDDKVYQPLDRASRNLEQPVYHVVEDNRNYSDA